jgi:hypothetical protein
MGGRFLWISGAELTLTSVVFEGAGQPSDGKHRPIDIERPAQLWKPLHLADDHPAQLHQPGSEDNRQLIHGHVKQVFIDRPIAEDLLGIFTNLVRGNARHGLDDPAPAESLQIEGPYIAVVECLCGSCRRAGTALEGLLGAPRIVDAKGATPFVMHRKDRLRFLTGQDRLKEYRLSSNAGTRRVIATCCNTPVFLEFKGGHWLSLYGLLWPEGTLPPLEMRTMVGDTKGLPVDVPNFKTHALPFYARLFGAWAKMGFRSPKIDVDGVLNV